MSASIRDVQRVALCRRQDYRSPLFIGRRIVSQIKHDIIDRTSCAPYNLCFLERLGLPMHAAQRAPSDVERDTALLEPRIQTARFKFLPTPGSGKEASLVTVEFRGDFKNS